MTDTDWTRLAAAWTPLGASLDLEDPQIRAAAEAQTLEAIEAQATRDGYVVVTWSGMVVDVEELPLATRVVVPAEIDRVFLIEAGCAHPVHDAFQLGRSYGLHVAARAARLIEEEYGTIEVARYAAAIEALALDRLSETEVRDALA